MTIDQWLEEIKEDAENEKRIGNKTVLALVKLVQERDSEIELCAMAIDGLHAPNGEYADAYERAANVVRLRKLSKSYHFEIDITRLALAQAIEAGRISLRGNMIIVEDLGRYEEKSTYPELAKALEVEE